MVEHRGILKWVNVGMGGWKLVTNSGDVDLYGDIPQSLKERQVIVKGEPVNSGIMMTSTRAIRVHSIVAAS